MTTELEKRGLNNNSNSSNQCICVDSNINITHQQYIQTAHSQRCLALLENYIIKQRLILMGFLRKKYLSIFELEQLNRLEKAIKSEENTRKCRYCMRSAVWQSEDAYFCVQCGSCVSFNFAAGLMGGEADA